MVTTIWINEYYGKIDWDSAEYAHMENIMLRAGFGAGEIDQQFRRNAQSCNDRKIPFGVYWQSYALNREMLEEEMRYCRETIEEFEITYPVYIVYDENSRRYAESIFKKS